MRSLVQLRTTMPGDASAIASIYAPHVLEGTASFEVEAPDAEEVLRRRAAILELGHPHLVAETGGEIAGYAYASRFRPRAAYRFTVENSVYVAERFQRRGIATMLMKRLIELCANAGTREMIAVIGDPSVNTASVSLHRSLGFNHVGLLSGVGEKFGRALDILIMQKSLPAQ